MSAPTVATVGVYGFDVERFLDTLTTAHVGLVVDVRQRRGVRGREYAWANSLRLQAALRGRGIAYQHRRDLAPTTALRHLQYAADAREGVGKRSRVTLAPEYVEGYLREVLEHVDLAALARSLPRDSATALLCVERDAPACHRSLIAGRLAEDQGVRVSHLAP